MIIPSGNRCGGSVLVVMVVMVLILFLIGTALLALGSQARVEAFKTTNVLNARCAADAGLNKAVQLLNNQLIAKTWNQSFLPSLADEPLPTGGSQYTVTSSYDNGYLLQSVGLSGQALRTIKAKLRLKGLFESAISCREGIILKSGTIIESIDSRISMNPADTDVPAVIGTNSTKPDSIILNNGVIINGEVLVGYGGDTATVIKDLGATTGPQYSAVDVGEFPPVSPPSFSGPDVSITVNGGVKTIGPGGDYPASGRFTQIGIKQSGILRVIGATVLYITGNVDMGQGCEIIIDPANNASLKLYVDGNFLADNSAGINNLTNNPSSFMLYGTNPTSQIFNLKAKSDAFGSVYAPNATVTIYSGGDVYGAFVSKSFELKNPAHFYYDAALRDVSPFDEGARFVINRWVEE